MSAIIGLFNRTRESLVGLDYLCEVTTGNRKPNYFTCILCDAEFENQATTLKHMTSFLHRVEYLKKNFPSTVKPAQRLLETNECLFNPSPWVFERIRFICNEIEKRHPRKHVDIYTIDGVIAKRSDLLHGSPKRKRYSEDFVVNTFLAADVEHQLALIGLSTVDFGNGASSSAEKPTIDEDQPNENRAPKPPSTVYVPTDLADAQVIAEYHKRYSGMFASVLENQKKYQMDPHSHPKYPTEWDMFWKERSRELKEIGKDPYDHDFTREWSLYWVERVKQVDMETIDRREKEIRRALNLPEDMEIPSLGQNIIDSRPKQMETHSDQLYEEEFRRSEIDLRHTLSRRETLKQDNQRQSDQNDDKRLVDAKVSQVPITNEFAQQPSSSNDDPDNTQDPVTIIAVLRLLSAFEDVLGNTLGPKVVDLLSKAIALEKLQPNLSNDLLVSEENNVLLETVKEKMKGLLLTGIVKTAQVPAVRKVIAHVNKINKILELRVKARQKRSMAEARQNLELSREKELKEQKSEAIEFRKNVYSQLETSIALQGKLVTPEQLDTLTNVYIDKHTANDTPYLFGLQMGSRFPDLPRKDENPPELGANNKYGRPPSKPQTNGASNDNYNIPANNFQRRNEDNCSNSNGFGQNDNQRSDSFQFGDNNRNSQSYQNPNDNRRFDQNGFDQFSQDQFPAGGNQSQQQQWSNSFNQNNGFNDDQQFSNNFGPNQQFSNNCGPYQQQQFNDNFGQNHHQQAFNMGNNEQHHQNVQSRQDNFQQQQQDVDPNNIYDPFAKFAGNLPRQARRNRRPRTRKRPQTSAGYPNN